MQQRRSKLVDAKKEGQYVTYAAYTLLTMARDN